MSNDRSDRLRAADPDDNARGDVRPAATVFVVIVGALLVAALLNAQTMRHRAETSPLGRDRDLALAFWRPVERVSSAFGLGLPRTGLDAIAGETRTTSPRRRLGHEPVVPDPGPGAVVDDRSGLALGPVVPGSGGNQEGSPPAGPSATPLGLPEPAAPSDPSTTVPSVPTPDPTPAVPLRRPTAEDPLRILIVGDSTMDAVGTSMLRDLTETGVTAAQLDFRISTGLSRPDFFDWPAHLRAARTASSTEVVVIMIGANDAQPFIIGDGPENYGTELWLATYRSRVASLLDELTAGGGWVLWIGQPVMRNDEFDSRMQELNRIYREELSRYPTAEYIDPRTVMSDESGSYAAYLVDGNGDRQLVRQTDGIHLTTAGGDRLSPHVIDRLNAIAPLY